jgi:NAD(P)-dependent dehydrogenase (short-subunit alcohol dehydrogenase family)
VNCAGINRRMPITDVSPAVYDEIMATNLRGLYFLSQAALPLLQARGGGKVLHIGSLTSLIGLSEVSVYGMAKSAVAQLTKTMAIEWAPFNVQVNCLCPGFIQTALAAPNWENPRRREWMLSRLPIQRGGQPDDVAGAALFLVSPAADYITGQSLYVDGGFTAGSAW